MDNGTRACEHSVSLDQEDRIYLVSRGGSIPVPPCKGCISTGFAIVDNMVVPVEFNNFQVLGLYSSILFFVSLSETNFLNSPKNSCSSTFFFFFLICRTIFSFSDFANPGKVCLLMPSNALFFVLKEKIDF